jgi:hypothetical protein
MRYLHGSAIGFPPHGAGGDLGTTTVFMHIYDGQPHPTAGSPVASMYLRLNGNSIIFSRSKAGKLVSTGTNVVSPDGKTLTATTTPILDANGVAGTNIAVYDKQ